MCSKLFALFRYGRIQNVQNAEVSAQQHLVLFSVQFTGCVQHFFPFIVVSTRNYLNGQFLSLANGIATPCKGLSTDSWETPQKIQRLDATFGAGVGSMLLNRRLAAFAPFFTELFFQVDSRNFAICGLCQSAFVKQQKQFRPKQALAWTTGSAGFCADCSYS